MDSPVRKAQKKNDYNRHKLLRKIKRRNKALQELEKLAAEKELRKKLSMPKYGDGKLYGVDGNLPIKFDEEGNLVNLVTGDTGTMMLPEVTIRPRQYRSSYKPEDSFEFASIMANAPAMLGDRFLQMAGIDGDPLQTGLGYIGTTLSPTKWIGSARTGFEKSIYDEDNPGLWGDKNLDLLTDILTMPKTLKAVKEAPKTAWNFGTKIGGKLGDIAVDRLQKYYDSHPAEKFVRFGVSDGPVIDATPNAAEITKFIEGPAEVTKSAEGSVQRQLSNLKKPLKQLPLDSRYEYVPESKYSYSKPKRTFTLKDHLLYNVEDSSGKTIRIKPRKGLIKDSGWSVSDIVDENGNIDTGYAISALRAATGISKENAADILLKMYRDSVDKGDYFLRKRGETLKEENFGPNFDHKHKRTYLSEDLERGVVERQGTLRHMYNSAKTAQQSPVAKGSTRQMLVFNALSHDIGELFPIDKDRRGHGQFGSHILLNMFSDIPEKDLYAIRHHMDNDVLFSNNPTLQALKFSDNASGRSYNSYLKDYPDFWFPTLTPITNIGKLDPNIPIRDVVKNHINPVLKSYGYDTIPLDIPESEQRKLLESKIKQHKKFLRGATDPILNKEDPDYGPWVNNKVIESGIPDPDQFDRLKYIATHTSPRSGSHGIMGIGNWSRKNIMPKNTEAIYTSNSMDVAAGYAGHKGEAMSVSLPYVGKDNFSLADMWQANDFMLHEYPKQHDDYPRRLSVNYDYKIPYRLYTGRSIDQDILKRPDVKNEMGEFKYSPSSTVSIRRRELFSDPIYSDDTHEVITPGGEIEKVPDVIGRDRDLDAFDRISKDAKYICDFVKENGGNDLEIKPNDKGLYFAPQSIYKTRGYINRIKDYLSSLERQRFSNGRVIDLLSDARENLNLTNKLFGYLKKCINSFNVPHDVFGHGIPEKEYQYVLNVITKLKKSVKKFYLDKNKETLESYKKIKNEDLIRKRNSFKLKILERHYDELMEKEGIRPMHLTSEALSGPFAFTTEGAGEKGRKNTPKSKSTKLKKIASEFVRIPTEVPIEELENQQNTGPLFRNNVWSQNTYLHYIFPQIPGKQLLLFNGFVNIPKRRRKDSSHVGRPTEGYSKKIE